MAEAERDEEGILLPVKRNSPMRECPLCLKEKRSLKNKICRDCDNWFLRNADGFYHNRSKITCPKNPDGGCGETTCSSCRLSNFMALTGFCIDNCPTNSCFFCNKITICKITSRVPQCSSCRKLFCNRNKAQECSCTDLPRKCPFCLVKKMIEVIGPRGTLGRPRQQTMKFHNNVQPFSQLDYEEAREMSDSTLSGSEDLSEDEVELPYAPLNIRFDGIPFRCQEKAKLQVLGGCKVVLKKILQSHPILGCKLDHENDSSKRNGIEHLSLHRDYATASTSLSVNSEDSEDVTALDGKPPFLFLNKFKEKYQELTDPLEISPKSGSQNQSTRPTSSPVIGFSNSGDDSVTGIVSLSSSPVLRNLSAYGSRKKKRYSNSNVMKPTSILPSTLLEDLDTSRTSVVSNSSMKRKTVDVGVQTDNLVIESLERENMELRALIKNLQPTLFLQSERSTLHDTIPSRSNVTPSTSVTSAIVSLSSPLPRAPCSPIICIGSPPPTESAFPTVEPTDASPWCLSEGLVLPKPEEDADDSHNASRRCSEKVPQVVVHRLTEKDLMKFGIRMDNMRQHPSSSQKLTSGSSSGTKRHRSLFSDSSDSDSDQPRVSTNAVPFHDSSVSSSKKKKLDFAHREVEVRVVSPNVTSGDKKGDGSKKSGDREPKLQGDKNSKDSDKKNRVRRDSEKDKRKAHKLEEDRKKEKEKRREKENEKTASKDKDAAHKKTEKAKSSHSSSGKSKDVASASSGSGPQTTKFKIPRVRQNSSPRRMSKAATQLEPGSVLRADQHPGARLPVASAHFSTPGTVGLPPLLYESPPPPVQQPVQQPAQQPVQEYCVHVLPEKDVPVQAMEVAASERTALEPPVQPALPDSYEPVENTNVHSTEGPKSLLRVFVSRSDLRKNVTFAKQLIDTKPQPRSHYDDLPDRVSSKPKETPKSTSKRRWFTGPSQEDSSDAESSQDDEENSQSDADTENPASNPEVTSAVSSSCDDVPITPVKFPLGERLNNSPLRNGFNPEKRSSPTKTTNSALSAKLSESTVRQTSPANPTAMEIDEYVPQRSNSESLNVHPNLSEDSSSESDSSSSDDSDSLSYSSTKEDPSQNNSTPEPAQFNVKTTPPEASSALNESRTGTACNESEDEYEDILDLGLDDSETFFDELECGSSNPGPSVESIQPAASTSKEHSNTAHRTPSPPTANNVSVAPVKPRILQSSQDAISSAGLCFYFIGHGTCPYTPNCKFEHDVNPSRVSSYMKQLCESNLDRAIILMTHVTKKESPLHAELGKDWGTIMSSTIIRNLASFDPRDDPIRRKEFAQKRVEYADVALKLLVNPEVRCTADMCSRVIDRLAAIRPTSPSTAVFVTRLYQRIDKENVEISSETWNKILKILTDVADWKKSLECLGTAFKYFPQFRPNAISMEFLFRDALTKKNELVAICNLVTKMDKGGIKDLRPELKRDVISALNNNGLLDMYRQQIFPDVSGGHVTDKIASSQQPGLSQLRAQQHVLSTTGIPLQQPGPSQLRALQQLGPSQPRVPLSVPHQPVVHPGLVQHQQTPVPPFRPPNPTVPLPQPPPPQPPPSTPALLLRPPPAPITLTPLSGPLVLTNENPSGNGLEIQRGPNVAVEPSYGVKEQLKQFYVAEDFERIAQLFISYSLNDVNRSVVHDLLLLLKTLPVPSPGEFIAKLLVDIKKQNGEGRPIPQHLRDALLNLALCVLNLLYENDSNKNIEGHRIIMAVEICKLNVFDYLEKKFIPPGALLFAARCCYEMEDLCMALCYLINFHRTVKDIHIEDELIKLEGDISFDVSERITQREKEIEEGKIAQSEEDLEKQADIIEHLDSYQNASEANRTRFNMIRSARGWM